MEFEFWLVGDDPLYQIRVSEKWRVGGWFLVGGRLSSSLNPLSWNVGVFHTHKLHKVHPALKRAEREPKDSI